MQTAQKFDLNLEGRAEVDFDYVNRLNLPQVLAEAQKGLEDEGYTLFKSGQHSFGVPNSILVVGGKEQKPKYDFFNSARELALMYVANETYDTNQ